MRSNSPRIRNGNPIPRTSPFTNKQPPTYPPQTRTKQTTPSRGPTAGALLFAVIGAKLSEGLNFADDLARSVVIIGMPYANLGSAELKERMSYVKRLEERRVREGKQVREKGAKDAAAELYENMCMNAVNQSIGEWTGTLG